MRFYKNVPQENREFLTEQLKKYEKEIMLFNIVIINDNNTN